MGNFNVLPTFRGDINNKYTYEINLTTENIYTGSFVDINLDKLDCDDDNYIPININSTNYLYVNGHITDYDGISAAFCKFSIFKNCLTQDIITIEKICDFTTDDNGYFQTTISNTTDFSSFMIKIKN